MLHSSSSMNAVSIPGGSEGANAASFALPIRANARSSRNVISDLERTDRASTETAHVSEPDGHGNARKRGGSSCYELGASGGFIGTLDAATKSPIAAPQLPKARACGAFSLGFLNR